MAKASTALAPIEKQSTALATFEGDKNDRRGKENIDATTDINPPRLSLAQALSPQLDPDKAEYIEGLRVGDIFDSLTQQTFARGPVRFVVLRVKKHAKEFDSERNIVDFDVPWNDPRCEFTSGPNKERIKPRATRFYDYLVLVLPSLELMLLSMSSTKTGVAKRLNSLLTLRPGAAWKGVYALTSVKETKGANTYYNFAVQPDGPADAETVQAGDAFYDLIKDATIVFDPQADADEDAPAATFTPGATASAPSAGSIPF